MIFRIAFKNIWRNKLRSWVLIAAIAIGIFGGLAVISTANGLTKMRQKNAIKSYVSHLQIHNPKYLKYGNVIDVISNSKLEDFLNKSKEVAAFSKRLKIESFVESVGGNGGVILNGIEPNNERLVTNIFSQCINNNYFNKFGKRPPIIISEKLAKRLNAEVGTSIKCSFTDIRGEPSLGVFKIINIFSTSNSLYDEVNAFVLLKDLAVLAKEEHVHEYAIIARDAKNVENLRNNLSSNFKNLQTDSWRAIAPELGYADKMMEIVMTLFLIIIMLALAFGIINTMLMAVFERKKEIGMLLSVGMNKRKIFWMILWESICLAIIAGPIGILISYGVISLFSIIGINVAFAADGLRSVGLDSTIYPSLDNKFYWLMTALVIITSILSCIYPARKALQLNPSETLRTSV